MKSLFRLAIGGVALCAGCSAPDSTEIRVHAQALTSCDDVEEWQPGGQYVSGDQVVQSGVIYTCLSGAPGLWCSQIGYEPGISLHWEQAWTTEGECSSSAAPTYCGEHDEWSARSFEAGERVQFDGESFECKGHPYTGWCSEEAYRPGTNLDSSAWNNLGSCAPFNETTVEVRDGMLSFADELAFQQYVDRIRADLEGEGTLHRRFENQLGFSSLKTEIEDQVELLDQADNLFFENDPDFHHFVSDDDLRAVMNDKAEYRIGDAIGKFLDETLQVVITDGDLATLEQLRAGDHSALQGSNIQLFPQGRGDEYLTRFNLAPPEIVSVPVSRGTLVRSGPFADDVINETRVISGGKWTIGGVPFETRGLVGFDLSEQVPQWASVSRATLDLRADTTFALYGQGTFNNELPGHSTLSGSNDFWLSRVTSHWDARRVTWNSQPSTTNNHAIYLPSSTSHDQDYLEIDVTRLIQEAIASGSSNVDLQTALNTPVHFRALQFAGFEHPEVADRATLHVELRPAGNCSVDNVTGTPLVPGLKDYLLSGTVSGTSGAVTYTWEVDGFTFPGSLTNEPWTFTNFGANEVCLSVKDASSCEARKCFNVDVEQANCQVQITGQHKGNGEFDFHATTQGFTSTINTFDWNYGDGGGTVSAGSSPSHSYSEDGQFTVCASATDASNGCHDQGCTTVEWTNTNCLIRCKEKGLKYESGNRGVRAKIKFRNNFIFGLKNNKSEVTGSMHHYRIKNNGKWRKTRADELQINFFGDYLNYDKDTKTCGISVTIEGPGASSKVRKNKRRMRFSRRLSDFIAIQGDDLFWRFRAKDGGTDRIQSFTFSPSTDECKSNQ